MGENIKKTYKDIIAYDASLIELYDLYKLSNHNILSYDDFSKLIKDFGIFLKQELLKGRVIYLPQKLGHLQMVQIKPKKPPVLFAEKKETIEARGKIKKFINSNTNGYVCRLIWRGNADEASFRNFECYRFVTHRKLKEEIKDKIKLDGHNKWLKLDNNEFINPKKYYILLESKNQTEQE